jgi:hypothetical protein
VSTPRQASEWPVLSSKFIYITYIMAMLTASPGNE